MNRKEIEKDTAPSGRNTFFDIEGELKRAVRFHQSGQWSEARKIYQKILETDSNHSDAMHLLGFISHQTGDNDTAFELISQAIRIDCQYPFYHNSLGLVLKDQGKLHEAVVCYQNALELKPDMTEALNNLGVAFQDQGNPDEAMACYSKALAVNPNIAEVHNNMGNTLKALDRLDEAVTCYETALKVSPDYAEAHFNLGTAYQDMEKFEEAITCYQNTLKLKPDYAEACFNMGNAFHELDRLDQAIDSYEKALDLKPDYTDAFDNMGKAYQDLGRLKEAISCYEKTLQLEPENADAHFDLSLVLLLSGDFKRGWKEYEWRFLGSEWRHTYPHRYSMPRWDGSSFAGKRLLVHAEQGLGDTLHFVRYLPMVKAMGGDVIFEAKKPLLNLLDGFPGIDELRVLSSVESPRLDFDLYVPLLSIPGVVGTTLETIPAETPYVFADPEKSEYWRTRLSGDDFKVGLVWAGSPSNNDDRNRSCDLECFFPLFKVQGITLYGIQKGEASVQADALPEGTSLTNLGEELDDFDDTAGLIHNLDLVISVDTAVAHLAGAMAKPVWSLLPFAPDWRWLQDRGDSPWYPTMRLFRQPKRGDWTAVFQRVAQELERLVS